MPLVTVLLPVYNAQPTLLCALRSLQRQTLPDWECLLVDDGSTDSSLEVCERFAARDPHFRLLSQPHGGIVSALNAGLSRARGEFTARMDADDLCHPDRLRLQAALLVSQLPLGLVGCLVRCFPDRLVAEGMRGYETWLNSVVTPEQIRRDIFVESPFAHPSVMARTSLLCQVGGYQDHGWPEDYDLWLRLYASGCGFAKVPETLLYWREHADRLSRTNPMYSLRAFRRAKVHYLKQTFLRVHSSVQIWGAGRGGRLFGMDLQQAGIGVERYIDIHSTKVGGRLRHAPIVPVSALGDHQPLPLLVCVGGPQPRAEIRQELTRLGYQETVDYVCVA
jgi:glycosyltransferase involved in cell wall biosynthesis